jgi:hypothetical protein
MTEQQQNLHASYGNVDSSQNQGLEFFEGRPHFAAHKEGAIVNAEREMAAEQQQEALAATKEAPAKH